MPVAPRAVAPKPIVAPRFTPVVDGFLTVHLPGEVMRCRVDRVIRPNVVIVEIDGVPMSKSHHYRKGDKAGAVRKAEFGREVWVAMDDREFIAHGTPEMAPEPSVLVKRPAKRAAKAKE
jgi:hypothetical protein